MDAWTWTLAWLPGCLPMWVCVCVCGWREDVKQASKKENDGIGKQARERRSPALTWLIKHLLVVCLFEKLLANVCPQVSCLPFFPPLQARNRQPGSATPFALCLPFLGEVPPFAFIPVRPLFRDGKVSELWTGWCFF